MRQALGRANLGFFAAFTLIASGCASLSPYDPGPGRRAAAGVVRGSYVAGEPVNVTIANLSDLLLFYPDSFCKTELQKKEQGGWLTVSAPAKGCSAEEGMLDPTQTVVHQFRLPSGLAAGTYRFAMPMPIPDDAAGPEPHLLTPSFRVEGSLNAGLATTPVSGGSGAAASTPKDR
ncbi:MAG: hypothetical protein ABR537_11170 [Gemmatimonadales bacterium]